MFSINTHNNVICVIIATFLSASCVQKTKTQFVEIHVDVRGVDNIHSMGVRGSIPPLSWNNNYELKDEDNDSIFSGNIVFEIPYDLVELKLVKNEDQFELKDLPNRKLYFDESLKTKYEVKFDQNE